MAGGGTGGHITPNIALLETLQARVEQPEILYIGSAGGLEKDLIVARGWPFKAISCGKLRRYWSRENFTDFFKTLRGVIQSIGIIRKFRPEVIFCKGGYVSLPVAIAGGLLRKPVVIHESDLEMGLANKIAAKFARIICVSFMETAHKLAADRRVRLTGNPIRAELLQGNASAGFSLTGFSPRKKVILVMGGSQGAQFINGLIACNLDAILKKYQLVQACGKNNLPANPEREGYFVREFLGDELKNIFAITDLFIGRAGANSLSEIEALGWPAILIPLSAGSRGDQIKNAESFAKHHPAKVLNEDKIDFSKFDLLAEIDNILMTPVNGKKTALNNAAEKITDILIEISHGKSQKA